MKTALLAFGTALALLLCMGCAGPRYAEGASPLVVESERLLENATDAIDAFLLWEHRNQTILIQRAPDVHRFAEQLRLSAPRQIAELKEAVFLYKRNRTQENLTALKQAAQILEAIVSQLRFIQSQQTKGPVLP